jgi:hypothetical protein
MKESNRMFKRGLVGGLLIVGLLLMAALPVFAGARVFSGTLTSSDPVYVNGRPDDRDCTDQIDDILPEKYRYQTRLIEVTISGTYTYNDFRATPTYIDIEVAFYNGTTFDPVNPRNNCIGSLDDSETIDLEAGKTYLIAITSWDEPTTGGYMFELDGPGDVIDGSVAGSCDIGAPPGSALRTLTAETPAYFEPDLSKATNFSIPPGTWFAYETQGDFTHLWITCGASPVWVPTSALS